MTKFRGCIDIHSGQVKQIVGGTLTDSDADLKTNFVATQPPGYFAQLYKDNNVVGTHVIKLGPGCDEAAEEALAGWPDHLQIGGGINHDNAEKWIKLGASHVIVTSFLFPDAKLDMKRLTDLEAILEPYGGKKRIVVDLSCRRKDGKWVVAMNRWQTLTDTEVNKETLELLAKHCDEFLIHAADVEGLCNGIDEELVTKLGEWLEEGDLPPVTYAGGAKNISDLALVQKLSHGKVDLTYGSALDVFGGDKVKFSDCVEWNKTVEKK